MRHSRLLGNYGPGCAVVRRVSLSLLVVVHMRLIELGGLLERQLVLLFALAGLKVRDDLN